MAGFGAFLTHVFFSLPQQEEKDLKKIFNTSIIFDFISNYTNYIRTSNSMGSSEIWDKYHECCIGNGDKFHEAKPSEIYHFQYNKSGICSEYGINWE